MAWRRPATIYAHDKGAPPTVPFFCYIFRHADGVPHFEVLPEETPDLAVRRAAKLLAERRDGARAELWQGDTLIQVLMREAA
jgi:hypothetical protein